MPILLCIGNMLQNVDDLKKIMVETTNSAGALEDAVLRARTPMDGWLVVWNRIKAAGIQIGNAVLPVISAIGNGVLFVTENLDMIGGVVAGLGIAWSVLNAKLIASKMTMLGFTVATKVATAAQWLFNVAASANPIGLIVMATGALIGGLVVACKKFDKFRAVVQGTWEVIKGFGGVLKDFVIDRIKGIISGLGTMGSAIAKLFSGDFKGAWTDTKKGLSELSGLDAVKKAAVNTMNLKGAFSDKYSEVMVDAAKSKSKESATAVEQDGDFAGFALDTATAGFASNDARAIREGSQTKNTTINIGTLSNIEHYSPQSTEINGMSKSEFERWLNRYLAETFTRIVASADRIL